MKPFYRFITFEYNEEMPFFFMAFDFILKWIGYMVLGTAFMVDLFILIVL